MQNKIIITLFVILFLLIGGAMYTTKHETFLGGLLNIQKNETNQKEEGGEITISPTATDDFLSASSTEDTSSPKGSTVRGALYTGIKDPGNTVVIDVAVLLKNGFIVIYENSAEPTGETLGTSPFLLAGEYTKIPITLSRDVVDGESFNAMLHNDDGDHVFDIANDPPFRDEKGNGVFTQIQIQSLTTKKDPSSN